MRAYRKNIAAAPAALAKNQKIDKFLRISRSVLVDDGA